MAESPARDQLPDEDTDYGDEDWPEEEDQPIDLDDGAVAEPPVRSDDSLALLVTDRPIATAPPEPPRFNKTIPVGLGILTAVITLLVTVGMLAVRGATRPHVAAQDSDATTEISVVAAPPATNTADNRDAPIPFTATPHGCLGGEAALSIGAPNLTKPWVCVLGGNIGQYLDIQLPQVTVVTAVACTWGLVDPDASGVDQWPLHRVPARVQWTLDDNPPVEQDTNKGLDRGPKPMPGRGLLASRIVLLVQETARPPAATPTSTAPGPDGLFGDVLEPAPVAPPTQAPVLGSPEDKQPVDNTFAVTDCSFYGFPPTEGHR